MRTLQPNDHQDRASSLCAPCVYYSKNLDLSLVPLTEQEGNSCGLGFTPGDEGCEEMRTSNCGMKMR